MGSPHATCYKAITLLGLVLLSGAHGQAIATPTATPAATAGATPAATPAATPTTTPAAAVTTAPAATTKPAPATPAVAAAPEAAADPDLPSPMTGAVPGDTKALLTTKAQKNGPTIIVDGSGKEVIFKGIGWYGFNIGLASLGNLSAGPDATSNDFKQIVYRIRMLGFNAVRVAFAFDDNWGINSPVVDWTGPCDVPTETAIRKTLVPGANATTTIKSGTGTLPPLAPPEVTDGICNSEWPQDSTYTRFIWVIDYLISQGMYIMLDFHSNRYGDSLAEGNESLYKQASWIASWVALVKSVLDNTPAATGRLLIDLINEPDGYSLTWEDQGKVPSLGSYYLNTIDALYEVCPGCLYLIEGGGQSTYCGVNWGNGFITDPSIVKSLQISSPTDFFNEMITRPWSNQVVLAPHLYCPEVSGADACFSGQSMYDSLDKSMGYLTVSPGWCDGSNCKVFPVILDEFGSTLNNENETSCMSSIISYANNLANPKTHAPMTSWFFWAWQPDSAGTGGIVSDDWTTIIWEKIGLLTGGTKAWPNGMSLLPWYLADFEDVTPIETNLSASKIALAPKAAVPVQAPVAAPEDSIAAGPQAQNASATGSATPTPTIPPGFINGNNTIESGAATGNLTTATYAGTTNLNSGSSSSLSTGALAGIIVGCVVFIAVIAAAIVLVVKLRNPRITESFTPSSGTQSPLAPGV